MQFWYDWALFVQQMAGGLLIGDPFCNDLRFGMRMLRKNPASLPWPYLTLALGIGRNTAIFTAFDALACVPRQVKDPDRLAIFSSSRSTRTNVKGGFSYPVYCLLSRTQ